MRSRALLAITTLMSLIFLAHGLAHGQDARQLNFLLFDAAKKGRTVEVISLLKQGASVTARERIGNTAMSLAAPGSRVIFW